MNPAPPIPSAPPARQRVLIVEDESLVALDLEERLTRLGYEVSATVDNAEDALAHLRVVKVDFVLMDIHIRGPLDGIETAGRIRQVHDVPVIFLTAHADDATLQRAGLTEPFGYVLKPFDERELQATIQMALYRHRAEARLHKMERWLSTTLRSIGDGVIATDTEGRINFMNAMAEALTGWSRGEAVGRNLAEVFVVIDEALHEETFQLFNRALTEGLTFTLGENRHLRMRDGQLTRIADSLAPIRDDDGRVSGCVVVFRDDSGRYEAEKQRKELEQKMHEAQRLESLGVLAGGIAHDFNNLLVAVTLNASLGRILIDEGHPIQQCLNDIEAAGNRAAMLCQQMLSYAGKSAKMPQVLEISRFTRETVQLLQSAIDKNTALLFDLAEDLPPIVADPSELQQIVMNLVINGSEAMEGRAGELRVRTSCFRARRDFLATCRVGGEIGEGDYVLLEVRDTGHGMTPEVLARIFDPFFTTKFTGRGLGLAAVGGIIRGHGGALAVESAPGVGTTFRVLFPVAAAESAGSSSSSTTSSTASGWRGSGRILLADDEPIIRLSTSAVLRQLGFEVDLAENGAEAVAAATRPGADYRAVLLDLTMPQLDGIAAIQAIRAAHPSLPVLLMSGYPEEQAERLFTVGGRVAFMKKPFGLRKLIAKLQPLLEGGAEVGE